MPVEIFMGKEVFTKGAERGEKYELALSRKGKGQ